MQMLQKLTVIKSHSSKLGFNKKGLVWTLSGTLLKH